MKVLSLPTHAQPRIVAMFEDLLEQARQGAIVGCFVLTESENGDHTRYSDGWPDNQIIFAIELVKRRMLEKYG